MRGVNTTIAATLVAEIGEIARFENPRLLCLGSALSPASIPAATRFGACNALARTMLVEASWSYRHPAHEQHQTLKRALHLPQEIQDIAWKAQTRTCKRFRDLSAKGKPHPRVLTAIARELAGFVWAIARKTQLPN